MDLQKEIRKAEKEKKLVLGSKRSLKELKLGKIKLIVVASNCPDEISKEVQHNIKISGTEMNEFEGNSNELGIVCKKPFPVAILSIKK